MSNLSEKKESKEFETSEAKELREVFSAISEFIDSIRGPIKEFINMFISALDGRKLGEEVAAFYNQLKQAGVPEKLAEEMTKEFLRKRLELAPDLSKLAELLKRRGPRIRKEIKKSIEEGIEEAKEALEEIESKEEE